MGDKETMDSGTLTTASRRSEGRDAESSRQCCRDLVVHVPSASGNAEALG